MIEFIQQHECLSCKFGKALVSLRDLRDGEFMLAPQEKDAPADPVPNPAPKANLGVRQLAEKPKGHKSYHASIELQDQITNYLAAHGPVPCSRLMEVLGMSNHGVLYHLRILASSGKIARLGSGPHVKWSLSKPGNNIAAERQPESDIAPTREANLEKVFECPKCGKRFRELFSLQEHKRLKHGEES